MKPSDTLHRNRDALRALASRHRVRNPRVFGSVLYGSDADGSDLDILVEPTAETTLLDIAALQVEAERLLGVPVDVLTPKSLPARFRERVLQEAQPV
jgi:predicted nucleotidyltransferase